MRKILIVDDDEAMLESIKQVLNEYNYEVFCAKSAEEFEAIAFSGKVIDLVILDMLLGNDLGTEVYENLVSKGFSKDIPIIYLTGLASNFINVPTQRGDHFALYQKPINGSDLVEGIQFLFSARVA